LNAGELADALELVTLEVSDVAVVLNRAGDDLDADDRGVVLAERGSGRMRNREGRTTLSSTVSCWARCFSSTYVS